MMTKSKILPQPWYHGGGRDGQRRALAGRSICTISRKSGRKQSIPEARRCLMP